MTPTITEIFVQFIISHPEITLVWILLSAVVVTIWGLNKKRAVSALKQERDSSRHIWESILTGLLAAYILTMYLGEAIGLHEKLVDPETRVIRATLSGDQITAVIGTEAITESMETEILGSQVSTVTITQENSMEVSPKMLKWLEDKQVRIAGEPIGKSAANLIAQNNR